MIKTIQQVAQDRSTSHQNVRQSRTNPPVILPIYALYNGEYILFGEKQFVLDENNLPENQQVIK